MPIELPALSVLDFAFIAGVLVVMRMARRWALLYALVVLPGTFLHELSHWLTATLLGGQPTPLTVLPARTERGWRLGSVGIRQVRWFNALPIALAPLVLAPLAVFALVQASRLGSHVWLHWALLYVAVSAAVSCLPSSVDWRLAASRPLGALLYAALAGAAAYAWVKL